MAVNRLRYTHRMTILSNTSNLYRGAVGVSMVLSATQPGTPFKVEMTIANTTDITGVRLVGTYNGSPVTENITLDPDETCYSTNYFDVLSSIIPTRFDTGATIEVNAIDGAFQPMFWKVESEPHNCTFSTVDGMATGLPLTQVGLIDFVVHYVRLPFSIPIDRNMEFTVEPIGNYPVNPYEGKVFVPSSDFDIVCLPPRFIPSEHTFRAAEKHDGDD